MNEVCPVSFSKVDENAVRLNAFLVILGVLVFLFTPFKWIIYFLVIDFALRASNKGKYSPLLITGKFLLGLLRAKPSMTDAKPKQFAALLGLIFSVAIMILHLMQQGLLAGVLSAVLSAVAAMEAALSYCVGCKVYYVLQKFGKTGGL